MKPHVLLALSLLISQPAWAHEEFLALQQVVQPTAQLAQANATHPDF